MKGYSPSKTGKNEVNQLLIIDCVALVLVDIQQPFYSKNEQIKKEFPSFADNVKSALAMARSKGMKVVHVRAVYNETQSPWISTFRQMNPEKWDWYGLSYLTTVKLN